MDGITPGGLGGQVTFIRKEKVLDQLSARPLLNKISY